MWFFGLRLKGERIGNLVKPAAILSTSKASSEGLQGYFGTCDTPVIKHALGIACFNGVPIRASTSHARLPRARVSLLHVHP